MLLAAMTQSIVFPEQVFLMMMLPAASTPMPRSAPMQLLPSRRMWLPLAWIPAPLPPLPLSWHALPRITQPELHRMPSRVLAPTEQSATTEPLLTLMPLLLLYAEQFETVQLVPV